jgi:hypothetical protein
MRKGGIVVAVVVAVLVTVPLVVMAASGGGTGRLDHQRFKFRTGEIATRSRDFHDVPGLNGMLVCARRGLSATVSVTAKGAPFSLLVRVDNGPTLQPGPVRFAGSGAATTSASYTWVGGVGPFEASDGHSFAVQWRSVTGGQVIMRKATFDLLFQDGTQC